MQDPQTEDRRLQPSTPEHKGLFTVSQRQPGSREGEGCGGAWAALSAASSPFSVGFGCLGFPSPKATIATPHGVPAPSIPSAASARVLTTAMTCLHTPCPPLATRGEPGLVPECLGGDRDAGVWDSSKWPPAVPAVRSCCGRHGSPRARSPRFLSRCWMLPSFRMTSTSTWWTGPPSMCSAWGWAPVCTCGAHALARCAPSIVHGV